MQHAVGINQLHLFNSFIFRVVQSGSAEFTRQLFSPRDRFVMGGGRLCIMPGVGPITALALENFTSLMKHFLSARDFAA